MSALPRSVLLPRAALARTLATLGLVLAPHLPRLPGWAVALVLGLLGWRALALWRRWPLPNGWLRTGLSLAAFAGVWLSFGRVSGQTAGVALITVMAALKLTELRSRRDLVVMAFLQYFLLVTHFLFSQDLWTAGYLLLMAVLITALLIDAVPVAGPQPPRASLRLAARLIAQALPLMLVMFVLFPRVPGPLWGLPADAGAGRSGLSDSMAPGEIASLVLSEAVAFRVQFDDPPPPSSERYWRGPVFMNFDGRRWDGRLRARQVAEPDVEALGAGVRHVVTQEPAQAPWLFALDLPSAASLPADARFDGDRAMLLRRGGVRERRQQAYVSYPRYRLQPVLEERERARALRLPPGSNPRSVALGRRWQADGLSPPARIERALTLFRSAPFRYTLEPPRLGEAPIDAFLFETRAGFCEHYASAFAVLMRAAGVPARIVTGYQGGERNAIGDYWIVRQSDAHAWAEVWLQGRGWVRVDPTAAIAPERVESGLSDALPAAELPAFLDRNRRSRWQFDLAARWDWLNARWNQWVLGYGPELQASLLSRLGLGSWREMILALTAAVTVLLTVIGVLLHRATPPPAADAAARQWQRLQARLARYGIAIRPAEGPQDYARRVGTDRPALAGPITRAAALYVGARYLQPDTANVTAPDALRAAIRDVLRAARSVRRRHP